MKTKNILRFLISGLFILVPLFFLYITPNQKTTNDAHPDYYQVVGPSTLDPATFNDHSNYAYSDKDDLGRTGQARATITYEDVERSKGVRGQFKEGDNPSGWPKKPLKNKEVPIHTTTGTTRGWFYNRSHLIADQLGGPATSYNAITGTRTQNVGNTKHTGGMQYIERKCAHYLETHPTVKLYYQVTPKYQNSELIPRTVEVEALTSDGVINEKVITYNEMTGYTIDYKTGAFQ